MDRDFDYKGWSLISWSIEKVELLTLYFELGMIFEKESDYSAYATLHQDSFSRAKCLFVRPQQIIFSRIWLGSVVTSTNTSVLDARIMTYNFGFDNESFVEIIAQDYSAVRW